MAGVGAAWALAAAFRMMIEAFVVCDAAIFVMTSVGRVAVNFQCAGSKPASNRELLAMSMI